MLPVVASWVMQKRHRAMAVAFLATFLPWCFWIGAAVVALGTLRKGFAVATPVIIAGLVGSGFWAFEGSYVPLCGLLVTLLMSVVLRARVSWAEMLIAGAALMAVLVQTNILVPPHAAEMMNMLRHRSVELDTMLNAYARQGISVNQLVSTVFGITIGAMASLMSVGAIAVARFCQAALYNPGGFRDEFHSFRLSPLQLLIMIIVTLLGLVLGVPSAILVSWVPLLIAGIALVHGVVGIKRMNGLWLVIFYILLLTAWPVIIIVLLLALIDTFTNIRGRLATREH